MSREVNIDIVEDATLERNQCMIETNTGIFNCSLDIELNNLIKNIKLLSCTGYVTSMIRTNCIVKEMICHQLIKINICH